jgi:hypothetical protein
MRNVLLNITKKLKNYSKTLNLLDLSYIKIAQLMNFKGKFTI